ncbi:MAG: DUF4388 domain-containing protein [Deltaproteobacteria bacterium]|nr:DUF4388 domain-containing protein [Deltaproteobacteria bacterium]
MKHTGKSGKRNNSELVDIFLASYPSKSRFAEAFRTMRTNIQFSFLDREFRSILITSAGESEGKTSAVANLSYTMAQAGKSVLMIDADLRKPFLSRLASRRDSNRGLTNILTHVLGAEVKKGSLKDKGITDLFRLISLQKKTGLLYLKEEREEVEILFVNGDLRDLNWLTRPEEMKLATILVKNNLLTKEDVKKALVRQKITGQKLGLILINMGLLTKEDLEGILSNHIMEGLRTSMQFKEGDYEFRELSESDLRRTSFVNVDFEQLYSQLLIGEEELPFLRKEINSSIENIGIDNLYLLPSGSLPPNPSELLGSERISFLIKTLAKSFDLIVIDTPPILPASDALLLAPRTDGVVLMTKAGLMNRALVIKAVDQLKMSKANILGMALNQVDTKREGYYRYYYKYYSKYYGEKD